MLHHVSREKYSWLKSLIALLLVLFCLWASQWQYHRGVDRHHRNFLITTQSARAQIPLLDALRDLPGNEWRSVTTTGTFDAQSQILLRNRYYEGQYGFEQLTLFVDTEGRKFWVDRGWVKAGKNALTPPALVSTPSESMEILGRLRLDSSLPRGSFFAVGAEGSLISKLNAQSGAQSENFYIDLISASVPKVNPIAPAQLPELTDGPHMAYALQWIFFGALVIYGRRLIRRSA
ncbi:unannotated protein [freshwater metagenome]|uniref:Unannotated protein n=1 Tax=freshwater metagenome TaxID=449393 RepID=A0A6J7XRU9_9ZZZZ|nr:hypothetical protein [Actinomycetota bacterium]